MQSTKLASFALALAAGCATLQPPLLADLAQGRAVAGIDPTAKDLDAELRRLDVADEHWTPSKAAWDAPCFSGTPHGVRTDLGDLARVEWWAQGGRLVAVTATPRVVWSTHGWQREARAAGLTLVRYAGRVELSPVASSTKPCPAQAPVPHAWHAYWTDQPGLFALVRDGSIWKLARSYVASPSAGEPGARLSQAFPGAPFAGRDWEALRSLLDAIFVRGRALETAQFVADEELDLAVTPEVREFLAARLPGYPLDAGSLLGQVRDRACLEALLKSPERTEEWFSFRRAMVHDALQGAATRWATSDGHERMELFAALGAAGRRVALEGGSERDALIRAIHNYRLELAPWIGAEFDRARTEGRLASAVFYGFASEALGGRVAPDARVLEDAGGVNSPDRGLAAQALAGRIAKDYLTIGSLTPDPRGAAFGVAGKVSVAPGLRSVAGVFVGPKSANLPAEATSITFATGADAAAIDRVLKAAIEQRVIAKGSAWSTGDRAFEHAWLERLLLTSMNPGAGAFPFDVRWSANDEK